MYRFKDFKFLEVFNSEGKKIGEIEDLAIDYFEAKIIGFLISKNIFKKENFIPIQDIVSLGERVIVRNLIPYKGLKYSDIQNLDIVNKRDKMIGVLEELLIDSEFSIKALVISKGFIDKYKKGKNLILLKETILGEQNILFFGSGKVSFVTKPHKIWKE